MLSTDMTLAVAVAVAVAVAAILEAATGSSDCHVKRRPKLSRE
jgi:hypothetical protein